MKNLLLTLNPAQIHRFCKSCKEIKLANFFYNEYYCNSCIQLKKKNVVLKMKEKKRLLKEDLYSKLGEKCEICGESNIVCLVVHHKTRDMDMKQFRDKGVMKYKHLLEDILNLRLFCANCHRKEHEKIRTIIENIKKREFELERIFEKTLSDLDIESYEEIVEVIRYERVELDDLLNYHSLKHALSNLIAVASASASERARLRIRGRPRSRHFSRAD